MEATQNSNVLFQKDINPRKTSQQFTFMILEEQREEIKSTDGQIPVKQTEKNNQVPIYNQPVFKLPKYNVLL